MRSYDSAPRPPPPFPPPPVDNLSLFLSLPVSRWSSLLREEEIVEEPNHILYLYRLAILGVMKATPTLQRHCTENTKQIFPEIKLRRLVPNLTFMYLWAIYIFPGLLTDTWMCKLRGRPISFLGIHKSDLLCGNMALKAHTGVMQVHPVEVEACTGAVRTRPWLKGSPRSCCGSSSGLEALSGAIELITLNWRAVKGHPGVAKIRPVVAVADPLKVDGNEKWGGREGHSNSGSVWDCGDRGLF